MTRFVKIQLAIFAVVTVVALTVMSVVFLKIPTALGWNRTDVALEMPDTGGLYQNANVSYLGKVIGRQGRTATAIRTVASALAGPDGARIDFVDVDRRN